MTNEKIIEAQKLIASIREHLPHIVGSGDEDIVKAFHKQFYGRHELMSGGEFELPFFYLQVAIDPRSKGRQPTELLSYLDAIEKRLSALKPESTAH